MKFHTILIKKKENVCVYYENKIQNTWHNYNIIYVMISLTSFQYEENKNIIIRTTVLWC